MAEFEDEYTFDGWENPRLHATIARLRRQRAKRRATHSWAMPDSEKRKELFAAGFTHREIAQILGTVEQSQ